MAAKETGPSIVKISKISALWMGRTCSLILTEDSIKCEEIDNDKAILFTVPLEDVLGLEIMKVRPSAASKNCRAILCTYRKASKLFSKTPSRRVFKEALEFSERDEFDSNLELAQEWKEAIRLQCLKNSRRVFTNVDGSEIEHHRFLVIINPFAGLRKSQRIYQTVVRPIFELAGVTVVHELITERPGHATEFVKNFDISNITGIILASGDGIVYEVINGLMSRPDWQTAIKTPLGVLPTGSGNALAASSFYEAGEEYSVQYATFQIVNGGIQSHDIASLVTPENHNYMAVVVNWAFTGDVDIESESLRALGGDVRNVIGALKCVAMKRSYFGRLSYLPAEENSEEESDISTNLLPSSVTDPVPDNWKTVEGNFVLFIALLSSYISHGNLMFPDLVLGSGEFNIMFCFEDVTRMELLKAVADTEIAIRSPKVQIVHTRAFRLEPITPGILSIDGERFEYLPFQIQVHKRAMRLFTRKKS